MNAVPAMFQFIQRFQGRDSVGQYEHRLRSQWWSREQIKERQLKRLLELVVHSVEHVPYYRELFTKNDIEPRSIRSFRDYAELVPMLEKDAIKKNLSLFHADNGDSRLIIHRTGGSSGQPFELPRDRASVAAYWGDYLLTRSWWGMRVGDPMAKIWGHYHSPPSFLHGLVDQSKELIKSHVFNVSVLSAYELSDENMYCFAEHLRRVRPASIYGYASALEKFARFLYDKRIDVGLPGSSVAISTSEPLFEDTRRLYREVFQCGVADEFGAAELGLLAFECPAGRLHMLEESHYLEIINEEGNLLDEGIGELLVTPLCNPSVPLLRYRIGDMGRLSKEMCPCGRGSTILTAIEGRSWSLFRGLNGITVYPDIIMKLVMKYAPQTTRFQAIQDRVDHVIVKLESKHDVTGEIADGITRELIEHLGDGTKVEVNRVSKIEPERSGKFIAVKSLISTTRS